MKTAIVGASGYSGKLNSLAITASGSGLAPTLGLWLEKRRQTPTQTQSLPRRTRFGESNPQALASNSDIETVFLALPHGVASDYAQVLYQAGKTISISVPTFGSIQQDL